MSKQICIEALTEKLKSGAFDIEPDRDSILVGYSGGLDSSLMLHAAVRAYGAEKVRAIHCHHGISANADAWAQHCTEQAEQLGVQIYIEQLQLEKHSEEAARNARYHCFEQQMSLLASPVLLLAHQADDQIETFLFRLFRGTGLKSLAGMPVSRALSSGRLVRPFLDLQRTELLQIAEQEGIQWVEDESNQDSGFDRNFLRNDLLPIIVKRWPGAGQQIQHAANMVATANHLLNEYSELLIAGLEPREEAFGQSLSIAALAKLEQDKFELVVRYWLGDVSGNGVQLSNRDMTEIFSQFFHCAEDASPEYRLGNIELRKFSGRLYRLKNMPTIAERNKVIHWHSTAPLEIKGLGVLAQVEGAAQNFDVGFRQGGERAKPVERAHSQSLKKLLQEAAIEPWLRERLPLVLLNGKIVSVADMIPCSEDQFHWQWTTYTHKNRK